MKELFAAQSFREKSCATDEHDIAYRIKDMIVRYDEPIAPFHGETIHKARAFFV